MASGIGDFGFDRAEIAASVPVNTDTDFRPGARASYSRKPTIRQTISGIFPSILAHPRRGFMKIGRVIREKKEDNFVADRPHTYVPVLAPDLPTNNGDERLCYPLDDRSKPPPAQDFILHPISALKHVAFNQGGDAFAENIAKAEVSHAADVCMLRQYDTANEVSGEQQATANKTFIHLKHARQDAFVRWSIDRHVTSVAIPPKSSPLQRRPPRGIGWRAWGNYGQQVLLHEFKRYGEHYIDLSSEWIEPSQALLTSALERVVVASTPLQTFFMQLRDISQWRNPKKSAVCMVLYFILLFYDQITRTAILYLLFRVLQRRLKPPDLDHLREVVVNTEDKDRKAHTFLEIILKYGTQGWVDQMIDQAGPVLLHNTERTADTLERLQNFYEWRDPYRTRITICTLMTFWILITVTPTWLLVHMSFLALGVIFFVLEPIGTHFPHYRLLASPFTWLLWKIPTHAEWAIARLQVEADLQVSLHESNASTNKMLKIIGFYDCTGDTPGSLTVTTTSVYFSPDASAEKAWKLNFVDLIRMHKISNRTLAKELQGLLFVSMAGTRYNVFLSSHRDEIFSQIVGYSRLPWRRLG